MEKTLFVRHYDLEKMNEYLNILSNYNIPKNITKWNNKTILDLYIDGYEDIFIAYKFECLRNWIIENEELSWTFINKLNKLINQLSLETFLYSSEKNYIYKIQSYVFSLTRNIKSLIVNFQLFKKEEAYFHYDYVKGRLKEKKFVIKGELYITNQRVVFSDEMYVFWIDIDSISRIYNHGSNIYIIFLNNTLSFEFADYDLLRLSFDKVFEITNRGIRYG